MREAPEQGRTRGQGTGPLASAKVVEHGQHFQPQAQGQQPQQAAQSRVFAQRDEAVAVVEVRLAEGGRRLREARVVKDHGLRHGADLVASELETPAQVYFLKVHEVLGIEKPDLAGRGNAEEKGCATGPKERHGGIVLALVALAAVEEPPPTKGVAQSVDIAAGSASVVEMLGRAGRAQFGLASGNPGIAVGHGDEGGEPVRLDAGVVVEQHGVAGVGGRQAAVAGCGKP